MPLFDRFILFLVVILPYQIYFPAYGNKSMPFFSVAAAFGFLWMLVLQLRHGVLAAEIKSAFIGPVLFYFIFWLSCCLAFFYSADKIDALKHVFYLGLVMAVYMQFKYRSAALPADKIVRYFLIASAPLAVMVLVVYIFKEHQYSILKFPLMNLFIDPNTLKRMLADKYYSNVLEAGRAGGVFVNAQEGALYAGFNILLAGWMWVRGKRKLYLGIITLWLLALLGFGTMTGIVAFVVTAAAGIVLMIGRHKHFWLPLSALMLVIIAGAVVTPWLQPRLSKYKTIDPTVNGRTKIWHASLLVVKKHWLSGVGLDSDTWNRAYNPQARKIGAIKNVPPHNVFLFVWAKAGVIAFMCILIFFVFMICRHALMFLHSEDDYALLVTLAFVWLGIECMTENFLIMNLRIASTLWMIMGMRIR